MRPGLNFTFHVSVNRLLRLAGYYFANKIPAQKKFEHMIYKQQIILVNTLIKLNMTHLKERSLSKTMDGCF